MHSVCCVYGNFRAYRIPRTAPTWSSQWQLYGVLVRHLRLFGQVARLNEGMDHTTELRSVTMGLPRHWRRHPVVRGRHGPAIRISVSSAPHGGEHRVDKISAKQCRQRRPAWGLLCWWWWHLPSRTATAVDAETYCNHRSHFERPSCRKMTDSYQFVSLTSCSSALTRRIGCMYRNTQNIGYINNALFLRKKCREMKSGNEIKTW